MNKSCFIQPIVSIALLLLVSCNGHDLDKNKTNHVFSVWAADSSLQLRNGLLFYRSGTPFTGEVKECWQNGKLKNVQHITNGKQQGLTETFYQDGNRESIRWYSKGEKDAVHTGWWDRGNKKYEYHFKNGRYDGLFTEWYQSGKMIQQVMYRNDKELYGKGWRETGKLYMNFVMKKGRRYGMNNSNLCYELKKETVK